MENEKRKGFNAGKFFFGLIVITIGILFLTQNLGWIKGDLFFNFWRLWPLILIGIGLSLLSFRGWFSTLIGIIIGLVMVGLVLLIIFLPIGERGEIQVETINISKEALAKSAIIEIKTGAGELKISGGSDVLLSGSFESNFLQLFQKSELKGDIQRINLETRGKWPLVGKKWNTLDLLINPGIPTSLNIDAGATKMDLDLTEVMIQELDIDEGASSIRINMGDKVEESRLRINAGVSSINITLPRSVGAQVTVDSGLSSKNLVNFVQIDSKHYESTNYGTAEKKINIDLKLGVSSLNINWK